MFHAIHEIFSKWESAFSHLSFCPLPDLDYRHKQLFCKGIAHLRTIVSLTQQAQSWADCSQCAKPASSENCQPRFTLNTHISSAKLMFITAGRKQFDTAGFLFFPLPTYSECKAKNALTGIWINILVTDARLTFFYSLSTIILLLIIFSIDNMTIISRQRSSKKGISTLCSCKTPLIASRLSNHSSTNCLHPASPAFLLRGCESRESNEVQLWIFLFFLPGGISIPAREGSGGGPLTMHALDCAARYKLSVCVKDIILSSNLVRQQIP